MDSSKIKQHVLNYNDEVSCGFAFFNLLSKSELFIIMIFVVWLNNLFSLPCDSFRGMTLILWSKSVIDSLSWRTKQMELCRNKSQSLEKNILDSSELRTDLLKSFSSVVPLLLFFSYDVYKPGCTTKMVSLDYIYIFLTNKAMKIIDFNLYNDIYQVTFEQ